MVWVGYNVGLMLGWDGKESLFLGAALAQTSSAVLIKFLRDSGQLYSTRGQLVLAISVVEDLSAVILLSLLTGIATTGASTASEFTELSIKLSIFAVAALVFGTLFVPRLLRFVSRFRSAETLLLTSLGLCFGLGLIAGELGLSATAGAFLIGTVVGDTEHSETIGRVTAPVRDMFAALFFVSIGMLVDFSRFGEAVIPILIVTAIFVAGKVVFNTVAAYFAGYDGRTALEVGTGMPQMGEFALAIAKVGSDHNVVGAIVYPVIAGVTAVSSLIFPSVIRLASPVADFFERRSPAMLKQYAEGLTMALLFVRRSLTAKSESSEQVRRASRLVFVNLALMAVILAASAVALHYVKGLASVLHWGEGLLGLAIGAAAITLCVPSGLVVWRAVSDLAERVTDQLMERRFGRVIQGRRAAVVRLVQQSILAALVALAVVWALPFMIELLSIGSLAAPLPIVVLLITVLVTARLAIKIHRALEVAFRRTILGE
jgi:CPA2 family monovalent cation:H+ antiporter-2